MMTKNEPDSGKLVQIFNQLFVESENTCLQMGADEPFYQAAKNGERAVIFAREDFFSSALHEIAHWTIAGRQRRKLNDFGYWYQPEGRSSKQQLAFEQVEIKPQAIEWLFSLACHHRFYFSADNLNQSIEPSQPFVQAVKKQLFNYLAGHKLPIRASLLYDQLKQSYSNGQDKQQAQGLQQGKLNSDPQTRY